MIELDFSHPPIVGHFFTIFQLLRCSIIHPPIDWNKFPSSAFVHHYPIAEEEEDDGEGEDNGDEVFNKKSSCNYTSFQKSKNDTSSISKKSSSNDFVSESKYSSSPFITRSRNDGSSRLKDDGSLNNSSRIETGAYSRNYRESKVEHNNQRHQSESSTSNSQARNFRRRESTA